MSYVFANHPRSLCNTPLPIGRNKKNTTKNDFIPPCEVPAAAGEPLQLRVSKGGQTGFSHCCCCWLTTRMKLLTETTNVNTWKNNMVQEFQCHLIFWVWNIQKHSLTLRINILYISCVICFEHPCASSKRFSNMCHIVDSPCQLTLLVPNLRRAFCKHVKLGLWYTYTHRHLSAYLICGRFCKRKRRSLANQFELLPLVGTLN